MKLAARTTEPGHGLAFALFLTLAAALACGEVHPTPPASPPSLGSAPAHDPGEDATRAAHDATEAQAEPRRAEQLELSFVGDIVLGRYRTRNGSERFAEMAAPQADPFAEVAALLRADVVVGNLESPIIRELPAHAPIKHEHRFGAGAEHVPQLVRAGFSVLSLANNHYFDLAVDGQREGPQVLAEAGLMAIGASREQLPLIRVETLEIHGWRVGFLAFSTVRNHRGEPAGPQLPHTALRHLDEYVLPLLEAARHDHDLLIVEVHWGDEYAEDMRNTQRRAAHELLDAGVDILIGHHPHVLQAIERHRSGEQREGLIAYSLGNFMFPRNDGGAELSAILRARYRDLGRGQRPCLEQARVHPIYMSRQPSWRPVSAPRFQAAKIRERLTRLSATRHTKLRREQLEASPTAGDALVVSALPDCPP